MKLQSLLVKAERLTKLFDEQKAVDGIDFEIHEGDVVGFLGPNGAGKTTTIRMMLNLLSPTSGDLTLFGLTFDRHRSEILKQMNSSSGSLTLPGKLTVQQNLKVFADLYGLRHRHARINELMEKFNLTTLRDRSLYSLSTGQQIRVSLAKAFLNSPRLLLLDEPTASLDPDVADRVRTFLVDAVKEEGTTVFLTSHNMSEVSKICTRVLFLNHGKIQAEGSPRELARRIKRTKLHLRTKTSLGDAERLQLPEDASLQIDGTEAILEMDQDHVGPFLTRLTQHGVEIEAITIQEPTMEDFFLQSARQKHL